MNHSVYSFLPHQHKHRSKAHGVSSAQPQSRYQTLSSSRTCIQRRPGITKGKQRLTPVPKTSKKKTRDVKRPRPEQRKKEPESERVFPRQYIDGRTSSSISNRRANTECRRPLGMLTIRLRSMSSCNGLSDWASVHSYRLPFPTQSTISSSVAQ
jgi:hypothetical protein